MRWAVVWFRLLLLLSVATGAGAEPGVVTEDMKVQVARVAAALDAAMLSDPSHGGFATTARRYVIVSGAALGSEACAYPPGATPQPPDDAVTVLTPRPAQNPGDGWTVALGEALVSDLCTDKGGPWGGETKLAYVIGHELGHLIHEDVHGLGVGSWEELDKMRQEEFAADAAGIQLALAAGYLDVVAKATAFWKERPQFRGYETSAWTGYGWSNDHPSDVERIAAMQADPHEGELWRLLTSFDLGVFLLSVGGIDAWEQAALNFEALRQQDKFRNSPEVLTNLGYSEMMQYYAAHINMADLDQKMVWQVSCQTFVTRRPVISGWAQATDTTLLRRAQGHFQDAIDACPDFWMAQANLGAALLLDPDASEGSLTKAQGLLERAREAADTEAGLQDTVSNLAVAKARLARLAQKRGNPDGEMTAFREALETLAEQDDAAKATVERAHELNGDHGGEAAALLEAYKRLAAQGRLPQALLYNYAEVLSARADEAAKPFLKELLEDYLAQSPETWYQMKVKQFYTAMGGRWQPPRSGVAWKPVVGVGLATPKGGTMLCPLQSLGQVLKATEGMKGVLSQKTDGSGAFTYDLPGLRLVGSQQLVRLVIITEPVGPCLRLGLRGRPQEMLLKVGDCVPQLRGAPPGGLGSSKVSLSMYINSTKYWLYPDLNVAVALDGEGKEDQVILRLALVPPATK
jgi:hypothetical protein